MSDAVASHTATNHDDLYGYFVARGMRFSASTLHLPDSTCLGGVCKYL